MKVFKNFDRYCFLKFDILDLNAVTSFLQLEHRVILMYKVFPDRVIRMSSPSINNVVLVGSCFSYVFVFLLGIDSRFVDDHVLEILCNVCQIYEYSLYFFLCHKTYIAI